MAIATLADDSIFSIDEFLKQERGKDLFRFSTAGSVDDGKSTLIGRLLFDTQSVYEDQLRSIEGKGTTAPGQIDFALLTDGLRAEREQGITIDVAYRYFSTARRKFIIADTPGHEQYTRNMATGCSTADATVVLIDARKGVLPQSRRHAYIASLLGVRHILVAVNKMDLVGYDEDVFRAIEREFSDVLSQINADTGSAAKPVFVPVSALAGDNVVLRSEAMPWYGGPSLLELLEALSSSADRQDGAFRFPVQRVLRPDHSFRGFAGQIASGSVRMGDYITAQPSGRRARVTRIVTYDGDLEEAHAPLSVTLVLDHELDISRGDMLVSSDASTVVANGCDAALVWMDQRPLDLNRRYVLKHASHSVPATVTALRSRVDIGMLAHVSAKALEMNDIGVASLQMLRPIALSGYSADRNTGAFILVDLETNSTAAAGMVIKPVRNDVARACGIAFEAKAVTSEERVQRWGHRGGVLELSGPAKLIDHIERSLFVTGAITVRRDDAIDVEWLVKAGLIALVVTPVESELLRARVDSREITIAADDVENAASAVHQLLVSADIIVSAGKERS